MLEEIEKRSFTVKPCLVNKDLVRKIGKVISQLKTEYILNSEKKDIKTDDFELFVGVDWPSNIKRIYTESLGQLGQVTIDLNFDSKSGCHGNVMVKGSDATWVEGVAGQLETVFENAKFWYYPFVEYWLMRLLFSAILMFLVVWRVNHSLWFAISQYVSLSEISFFFIIFLASFFICAYPLNRFLVWMFPRYEFEHDIRRKIRKYFAIILGLLVTWILTERIFPSLIP